MAGIPSPGKGEVMVILPGVRYGKFS